MVKLLLLCLVVVFAPFTYGGQFHFQLENDVTFGEDGNYSNGIIIGWESQPILDDADATSFIQQWQKTLFFAQPQAKKAWGVKVTQRMWTPDEIKITVPQPDDRPYAGFLEFEHHIALYGGDFAQKNWLSIGIIGPASGTEQLQGAIHKLLGASTPAGWPFQIENKATFQFGYEVDSLLLRKSAPFDSQWEISAFNYNTLGNLRSDINLGLTLRWGPALQQSFGRLSSHFGHVGNSLYQAQPYSLLFFTRMQVGYRFNDLTIDGSLPYVSQVEFNPYLVSATTGASYTFDKVAVTWSFNFYNKEYLNDNNSWHGYGSLLFTWLL